MRTFSLMLLTLAVTVGAYSQVLYSITGNGLSQPSYILGTLALAPASYVDSIPGLKSVFGKVERAVGEISTEEAESEGAVDEGGDDHELPDDLTWEHLLTASEIAMADSLLNLVEGVNLDDDDEREYFHCLDLRVIASMLIQNELKPAVDEFGVGLDAAIQMYVPAYGGLESNAFQEKVLYPPMDAFKQRDVFQKTLANYDAIVKSNRAIVTAYYTQNLKAIEAAYDYNKLLEVGMKLSTQKEMDEQEERIITRRNQQWFQRMPKIMAQKSTLFAVGVGHLIGKKGLLQLLRNGGYTLEPVKTGGE